MRRILLAYLFLLLDLQFVVNWCYFSLLLPLCAAGLLVSGFATLTLESEQFERCVAYAVWLGVLRSALFMVQSFHLFLSERAYAILAAVGVLLLFFAITHAMLVAFREVEEENNLFAASRFCVVGEICLFLVGCGCIWGSASPTLGVNFFLLSLLASGLFLLALYKLQSVYARIDKID